eukprot:scaffold24204_cov57-Attheya_sp.AAC.1
MKKNQKALLVVTLLVFSLQAATVLQLCEYFPFLKSSPNAVVTLGVGSLVALFGLSFYIFHHMGHHLSILGAFFTAVLWSATIDSFLAAALVGWTDLGKFYYDHGEEYFKTSWGFAALLWDGTFHYALQFYIAYSVYTQGKPHAIASLVWAGSIINSMPVLLIGAATGSFSETIKPATALNAPYVLVPIMIAKLVLTDEGHEASHTNKKQEEAIASLPVGFASLFWINFHVVAITLHIWRAIVVLECNAPAAQQWRQDVEILSSDDDGSISFGFLRIQLLQYLFYYVPFHAYCLWKVTPDRTMSLWATFMAGGYLQGQSTFLVGAAFDWVGFGPLVSIAQSNMFWVLNVGLLILPGIFAVWCWRSVTLDRTMR